MKLGRNVSYKSNHMLSHTVRHPRLYEHSNWYFISQNLGFIMFWEASSCSCLVSHSRLMTECSPYLTLASNSNLIVSGTYLCYKWCYRFGVSTPILLNKWNLRKIFGWRNGRSKVEMHSNQSWYEHISFTRTFYMLVHFSWQHKNI